MQARERTSSPNEVGTGRLETLTDGIFAIAIMNMYSASEPLP